MFNIWQYLAESDRPTPRPTPSPTPSTIKIHSVTKQQIAADANAKVTDENIKANIPHNQQSSTQQEEHSLFKKKNVNLSSFLSKVQAIFQEFEI